MSFEHWRCTRRTLLKGAVLSLAGGIWAGCHDDPDIPSWKPVREGPFDIVGEGMYEAFKRWRDSLSDIDRAIFEQLMRPKEPLLIHLFLATGRLPGDSRGGASAPASDKEMKRICDFHPLIGEFTPKRNWDVAYDPERTKWFEETYRIPSPPEVILHHEIFGHLLPGLNDPNIVFTLAKDERYRGTNECRALCVENRYRRQIGLPEVPPELVECLAP